MIAAKRVVMIDDLVPAFNAIAELSPGDQTHPAFGSRARSRPRARARVSGDARLARRSGLITCATCRMTYLPSAVPPAPLSGEAWVCHGCEQKLG